MSEYFTLSPAMEDYLEIILELSEAEGGVRVTDIAARLNITKASVTQAINSLKNLNLVYQDKYGPVQLTKKGREKAEKVRKRHRLLYKFLADVLKVEPQVAEKDACLMEHVVSQQTMEQLVDFLAKKEELDISDKKTKKAGVEVKQVETATTTALNRLSPGTRGKIVRIDAPGNMRRRILEMGLVSGTEVIVEGVAPMGDPIEVIVKGYHLTLRKNEAEAVVVEVL